MKKLSALFAAVIAAVSVNAQIVVPEGYELVDSLVYTPVSTVDRSLEGQDIYSSMPSCVNISQSSTLRDSLAAHILRNESKKVNGYRIRIFFDNKRDSRTVSEETELRFRSLYRGYNTYRSFSSPFFKVTVGDFRTRTEASAALRQIKRDFPNAFIVKEKFRFPSLDPESYVVDTVKVIRRTEF